MTVVTIIHYNLLFQCRKSPDGQYQKQIIFSAVQDREALSLSVSKNKTWKKKKKTWSWLWLRSWIHIVKFSLKLKKVGKTTRSFRYDLNRIPYYYTVEVMNRFKGLDLVDRVPEKLWMEVCKIVQEAVTKSTPKKKKCKKAKWLSEEALQIAKERRDVKGKGERERYTRLNAKFQRVPRRDKKSFLKNNVKK